MAPSIKADGEETRQSINPQILCESLRHSLVSRRSTAAAGTVCRIQWSQDAVFQAQDLTGLTSVNDSWNFARNHLKRRGKESWKVCEYFLIMTTETITKINPNNCAHEQLFKASGRVEAEIATTVMKDNYCASGKEGIKGNDQTDNRPSLCKPEDLFLRWLILRTS